jgi:uncharacterized protein involved in outer membrane biogenesis
MNFGVLIAWVALSCITLPLFQWFMRRRLVAAQGKATMFRDMNFNHDHNRPLYSPF